MSFSDSRGKSITLSCVTECGNTHTPRQGSIADETCFIAPKVFGSRTPRPLVGDTRQVVGEVHGRLGGLVLAEPVFGDETGQVSRVDPAGEVVSRRNGGEGTRVVHEPRGVVEAGRLGRQFPEAPHTVRAVEE